MCVPLALACAAGMVVMLFNKGFHIRVGNSDQQIDVKRVVLGFAYPAGAFCISCTVVSVCSSLLFAISSGALGSKHLAHIGVDVISSTRRLDSYCRGTVFVMAADFGGRIHVFWNTLDSKACPREQEWCVHCGS